MDGYKEVVTTALDVLAVLLVAFGLAALVYPFVGLPAVGVAGVTVLALVRVYEWIVGRG